MLKWLALAVTGWLLLSLVLFLVSAQTQEGASESAKRTLASGGSLLSGSTILVLGSDARTGDSIDKSQQGPSRADTIMLVRAAFGGVRKLSIPRDSFAEIPGHGGQKINAAYALGGAALMIRTVEGFMGNGVQVNHLIEVDFKNFPKLIDSLGRHRRAGGAPDLLASVRQLLEGPPLPRRASSTSTASEALGFARIRKNACAPNETDIQRAQRQQQVLTAIKDSVVSPGTFFRLPARELAGAARPQDRHEGPPADGALRGPRHRQQRRDDGARAFVPVVRSGGQPRGVGRAPSGTPQRAARGGLISRCGSNPVRNATCSLAARICHSCCVRSRPEERDLPRTVRIALLCLVALVAAAPVAEAKVPKAPSGLTLYKPPKSLAKYTHGDLIWARKVANPLPQAGRPGRSSTARPASAARRSGSRAS